MSRYLVGMSGGLDSSVAAALLVRAGHEVIGASLRLEDDKDASLRSCCSQEDLAAAKHVCDQLGIPYYVFDQRARFDQEVIAPFVASYLQGRTPNPCVLCNQHFKFGELLFRAQAMQARLATGHYARRIELDGQSWLARAVDADKDQSYFLYRISPKALDSTDFVLGEYTKPQVRALSEDFELDIADRPESQEVCFAPFGAAALVEQQAAGRLRPGVMVDEQGGVLAEHPGVHRFTVGQRRGLGLGGGPLRYVLGIDADARRVVVGDAAGLLHAELVLSDLILRIPSTELVAQRGLTVKIRGRHAPAPAIVQASGDDRLKVVFDQAQRAPARGQAAVIYRDELVLGGGTIELDS